MKLVDILILAMEVRGLSQQGWYRPLMGLSAWPPLPRPRKVTAGRAGLSESGLKLRRRRPIGRTE